MLVNDEYEFCLYRRLFKNKLKGIRIAGKGENKT
jgi:hypothetical protein